MIEFHWTEVAGVATVWTDAPGPLRAGLLFRTGRADEVLTTAGRTHLIEHMVASAINSRSSNAYVDNLFTGFVTMGNPEDVTTFFLRVCEILKSLPGDRLEAEKRILLTEAASRPHDICGNLLTWRFGAARHGLRGMPELGTRAATLEQLHAWRLQRFTRGNAVLWLSGPLPTQLSVVLPPGEKQPLPPLRPVQPAFPSWFRNDMCGGIAAGTLVPRVSAASIFGMILSTRLHEWLRMQQAVSYNPCVFYEPLNVDTAHMVLYADSDVHRRPELAEAFGEIIEKLAEVEDTEVEKGRKQYLDGMTGPLAPPLSDRAIMEVQRAAIDWLLGREFESIESLAAEAASVSTAEVAAFASEMKQTALFALPGGAKVQPWMGKQAPISTGPAVEGREIAPIDAPIERARLIHGRDGVSIRWPDASHVTVRYSDLAAALCYEDGGMCLIGADAASVNLEPTLWRNGASICREIHERIPEHLVLEQGARTADAIPKPKTTPWQRFRASLSQQR